MKWFKEIIQTDNYSVLRTLGTCSIKVQVDDKNLKSYNDYSVLVKNNVDEKIIKGKIIKV